MGLIPTYMIVVKDNVASEYYASITIPRWEEYGYDVEIFDAITPTNEAPFKLVFGSFNEATKYVKHNIHKKFTPTEKAVWYSHVSLWLKCIELKQNIMVLEHDCYLIHPHNITILKTGDFVVYDKGAMGCYVISPRFARHMCNELITKKRKIKTGPLGYVDKLGGREPYHTIFHNSLNYKNACNQIYNPEYMTTIKHYADTEAEKHTDKIGYFEYILAETNRPIDVTKTIKVRTE